MRRSLRRLRQQLAPEEVHRLSTTIREHLLASDVTRHASSIGLYLPTDNEVDTTPLLQAFWGMGKRVFLPVVEQDRNMAFYPIFPGDETIRSRWGIEEPPRKDRSALPLAHMALLLIPLVGFDQRGGRLGFGGGFFDRLLGQDGLGTIAPPWRIGVAYGFQEIPRLPEESHDIPLHGVVTETGLRWFHTPGPSLGPRQQP